MNYVVAEKNYDGELDIIDTPYAEKQYHILHQNGKESYETEEWVRKNIGMIGNLGI